MTLANCRKQGAVPGDSFEKLTYATQIGAEADRQFPFSLLCKLAAVSTAHLTETVEPFYNVPHVKIYVAGNIRSIQ